MYPSEYKYTSDHQWVALRGDACKIGITHHAQRLLGHVVYIVLPPEGAHLTQGQPFGIIETCDAVLELRAPVSGKVLEVNTSLNKGPAAVNADPHGSWIVAVKLHDGAEHRVLLDVTEYVKLVGDPLRES